MYEAQIISFPERPDPSLAPLSNTQTAEIIVLPYSSDSEFRQAFDVESSQQQFSELVAPRLELLKPGSAEEATPIYDIIYRRYQLSAREHGIGHAVVYALGLIQSMANHPSTSRQVKPPADQS